MLRLFSIPIFYHDCEGTYILVSLTALYLYKVSSSSSLPYTYCYISLILFAYALLMLPPLLKVPHHYRRCISYITRIACQQIDLVPGCCRISFVRKPSIRRHQYCNHWHRYYIIDHSHIDHGRERGTE